MMNPEQSRLPTRWGEFDLYGFRDPGDPDGEPAHILLALGNVGDGEPVLTRVHSECLTGDALFSLRCDCGEQLQLALKAISEEGRGALLYLRQEGRGIGLLNKIKAYRLQDEGADTVQANEALGFEPDLRDYAVCGDMLRHLSIAKVRLMTNNPRKLQALEELGIEVVERIPIETPLNPHNRKYLATKAGKLGHLMS